MKQLNIKQKLENLDVTLDAICLGDFDVIGEYTAKRNRAANDPNYKKTGAFYRSNYERGILVYYLIRQHNLKSMMEIGFGRGYVTLCAAKAFFDAGIDGTVVTIDPVMDEKFITALTQIFPAEWWKMVKFCKNASQVAVPEMQEQFDLIYVDGDHNYASVKADFENCKDKFNKFLLFDDYCLPSKIDPGLQCQKAIDEINYEAIGCSEPELVIMDRIIFENDKKLRPDQIDYGQVLFTKK
jgi:predicted O-methyltransferase YrrM